MVGEALHPADRLACERMAASRPLWDSLEPAASAVGLEKQVLLHAGPPFASASEITRPILNSACVAAVFEGLAADFDAAEAMIAAGDILLKPAQDHGVVTPLAAVVSASMPLHGVRCGGDEGRRVFTPINGGSRPSMRLGLREQAVLDHIRWLNGPFCETLSQGIGEGIDLIPLAVAGLQAGDDCHGRTIAATEALVGELQARTPGGIGDAEILDFMASSPSLFLNLWMAATKCMMTAASGIDGSSFVTAAAGNGAAVGIQVSGLPGRWFTAAARPPKGPLDVDLPAERALGAIGDSAVVEAFGLGAMAFHLSPEQMQRLGPYLPPDSDARVAGLLAAEHPGFQALGIRLGITARAAADLGVGPVVGLGMLDHEGHAGRIGGGIYDMPAAPFRDAVAALGG